MKFICSLIVVENMARARAFYEQVLGQKVKHDFVENVYFEGGFSLHLKSHFLGLLRQPVETMPNQSLTHELYFETVNIKEQEVKLVQAEVKFVHSVERQPWGQKVMRFYDPDGHLIEVGEPMEI